jgi:hypothetical protein
VAQSSRNTNPNFTTLSGIMAFIENDSRFTWMATNNNGVVNNCEQIELYGESTDDFFFCVYNWRQIDLYALLVDVIPHGNSLAVYREHQGDIYDRSIFSFLREHTEYTTAFFLLGMVEVSLVFTF